MVIVGCMSTSGVGKLLLKAEINSYSYAIYVRGNIGTAHVKIIQQRQHNNASCKKSHSETNWFGENNIRVGQACTDPPIWLLSKPSGVFLKLKLPNLCNSKETLTKNLHLKKNIFAAPAFVFFSVLIG